MVLFDSAVSGNCYKVRLLLAHLGLPYERREVDVVDRSNRKELLGDLNPALRVPTLVFEDGRSLAESNAILWYLGDGTQYLPAGAWERAKVLQWLFFEQYSHEPHIAVARFWLHVLGAPPNEDAFAEKLRLGHLALEALEQGLDGREYLVGDVYSIADIALYAYTHLAGEGGFDLARYPAIGAWIERVAAQPGHVILSHGSGLSV
jgi:glutathione S-transferase